MARPNVVLITADDMNWDAVGAYGCPVAGTTPHIDGLAASGVRFEHGHVTIAVCQPSRSAMMTGRYPHRSGSEGFFHLRHEGVPILPELLREAGYSVGILGKVGHSTPYASFHWDMTHDMAELGYGRNPAIYARHTAHFVDAAKAAGKPFFLMLNSHDPHRPFYGNDRVAWYMDAQHPADRPSRVFTAKEIGVPAFLEDLPEVRQEIAEYYSSVRRCDDMIGAALATLEEAGCREDTLVIFLSDNGMAFPFAKTNCYLQSTKTPLIMSWPEVITPGRVDRTHFVSGIDLLPTILEAAGAPIPAGVDGTSCLPVLRGQAQAGRELVFTQFYQTSARRNYPMRCVQDRRYGYIYNPWSDGERVFHNESQSGRTFAAMEQAAQDDEAIAARVRLFLYRVPEELYDFATDPAARVNLIDDARYSGELARLTQALEDWMVSTGDPALAGFRRRGDGTTGQAVMAATRTEIGGT